MVLGFLDYGLQGKVSPFKTPFITSSVQYQYRGIKRRTNPQMASTLLYFFTNPSSSTSFQSLNPSVPITTIGILQVCKLSSSAKKAHNLKLNPLVRASAEAEGLPAEIIEDPKFVPLNAEDLRYGPPALLLMGFDLEETTIIQEFLKEIDGEFMQIILFTEDMINGTLNDAISTPQQNFESLKIARDLPRICFLSGLTGEEIMMFIDALPETGLDPGIFAALVPNNADKPLQEIMEEIMADHEMMSAKHSGSTEAPSTRT